MIKQIAIFALILLLFSSCKKDEEVAPVNNPNLVGRTYARYVDSGIFGGIPTYWGYKFISVGQVICFGYTDYPAISYANITQHYTLDSKTTVSYGFDKDYILIDGDPHFSFSYATGYISFDGDMFLLVDPASKIGVFLSANL